MRTFFILISIFLLSGCMPIKVETPATYVLSAPKTPQAPIATRPTSLTLLISTPKAAPGYDSPRMIYVDRAYQLSHFTKNRWADSPARMLTPLFLQSLQATRHFQAVVSAPYMGDTDLRLDTELLMLQQDFTQKPSQVRMVLVAQMINVKTNRILATRQFDLTEQAQQNDPYSGVVAANRIVARLLPQLATFAVHNTR